MKTRRPRFPAAVAVAVCIMSLPCKPTSAESLQLATPRGARIEVLAEFPAGATGPVAAVVIAPGANYPMRRPLMEATASELLARGVAVWRFDWAYTSRQPAGRPSPRLADELEDLRSVVEKARSDSRVAADRLFVAGKSLGSGVAWQVLASDPGIRGGVLLTPVCSERNGAAVVSIADENYPGVARERRPLLLVAGDSDPLCEPAALYRLAAAAGGPSRVSVIGGNHGFERTVESKDFNARNVQRVGQLVADFIEDQLQ